MDDTKKSSLVIITGNEKRHRFLNREMCKNFNVLLTIFEVKANVHKKAEFSNKEKEIVEKHFELREQSEEKYFGNIEHHNRFNVVEIGNGDINTEYWTNKIKLLNPNYILLFGSSIVKEPLLNAFENRVINLHLGLSPYYRGSGTNFWPLVHKKVECVGSTIHLASQRVDGGEILHQVRPDIELGDTIHDLGNKTIIKSIEVIPKLIFAYENKLLVPISQSLNIGILCRRKELTASSIETLYNNFNSGMIEDFIRNKEYLNNQYPIIDGLILVKDRV